MAVVVASLLGVTVALGGVGAAQAATNPPGSLLYVDQTFYAYVEAGETLDVLFTRAAGSTLPVTVTVTDPAGVVAHTCTHAGGTAVGSTCGDTDLSSTTTGAWKVTFDESNSASRYSYDIVVRNASDAVITGRIWTTLYSQMQTGASMQTYWVATREGYLYSMQLINFNGVGSQIRANGFGLVDAGTCTPTYQSAEGTSFGANGVFLDPSVEYSTSCGEDYLLFLEQPSADLPPQAPSVDGTLWVRPTLVQPSATDLALTADSPYTRAGEFTFDLAGVNGGYSVQIDANADGDYDDSVDRVIPWGSPPGAVTVPFDGLDGEGNALSVCAPLNARVVVDRTGETHFVLEDVEQLGNGAAVVHGIKLTGLTQGIVAPAPLLYWDDTNLAPRLPNEPFGTGTDGTSGVDTSALPADRGDHGWRTNWGDMRSIENWTYYQAQAGAETTIEPTCSPALTLDKESELDDANDNGFADPGETITYTFDVRNTGNAPIADVEVVDDRVASVTPATADIPVFGQQLFTSAPYTVTQQDVDAGGITNLAIAGGVDPGGSSVISNEDSEFVPTAERDPRMTLDKQAVLNDANTNGLADLGETIDYSFLVTNTGNVTITDISIDDPRVTGVTPTSATLAPGAATSFVAAPYVVTQADLNIGSVDNSAVASGTSPTGPVDSNTDQTTTPTPVPDPQLVLDKSAVISTDADGDGRADVGDVVTYTFTVDNPSTVDLVNVSITDPRVSSTAPATHDIPAGETRAFTATYTAAQADVDAGSLPNTASAHGTWESPDGPVDVLSAPDTEIIPTPERAPALVIDKEGTLDDRNGNGAADVGETITYAFVVTNTGNVTLANVAPVDDRVTGITPAGVTLAPSGVQEFTSAPYTVTQEDVDAGEVVNVAFARGNIPGGAEVFSAQDTHTEETPEAVASLVIDKLATLVDGNGNGTADEGEQIAYAFTVTNTGNVTLVDVTVNDDRISGLLPESIDFLPPAASFTFNAEPYTVTAADVAAGEIVNVASATGVDPDGDTITSEDDSVTVDITDPVTPTPPVDPDAPAALPDLAATGVDPTVPLLAGSALLLLGTAAVLIRRRSRVTQQ